MKKIIWVMSMGVFFVTSCQKEKAAPAQPVPGTGNQPYVTQVIPAGVNAMYYSSYTPCAPPTSNCVILPEVVIRGLQRDQIVHAASQSAVAVGTLFSSPGYADLCRQLPADIASNLKSGTYALKLGYEDATTINFITGPGTVSEARFEYAIQFTKK